MSKRTLFLGHAMLALLTLAGVLLLIAIGCAALEWLHVGETRWTRLSVTGFMVVIGAYLIAKVATRFSVLKDRRAGLDGPLENG